MRTALRHASVIAYPADGLPVHQTVAEALRESVAPQAELAASDRPSDLPNSHLLRIGLAGEGFARGPETLPIDGEWMYFRLDSAADPSAVTR